MLGLKTSDGKKAEGFGLWCYRRLLRKVGLIGNQMNWCWKRWIVKKYCYVEVSCDLLMGSVYVTETEVDQKRGAVTALRKELELV